VKAKSIEGTSPEALSAALESAMRDGFKPTLAVAFVSIKFDLSFIQSLFTEKGIDLAGATSSGEFIDGYEGRGSAVFLLLDMDRSAYHILFEKTNAIQLGETVSDMTQKAMDLFKHPGFILLSTSVSATGDFLDGETIIRTIEKTAGEQVTIFGGMAGDDSTFTGTYVFTTEQVISDGIILLVLDEDKISLQGRAISGWKPLGITRTVTKSEGQKLLAIDDQPALDMYLKYLGHENIAGEDKYSVFESVGLHYPFQVEREIGDPAMVTPIGIDQSDNGLICESKIPEGSRIRFSTPPDFDIVEKVLDNARELKNSTDADADAMLIFSCLGRFSAMGPMANAENEGLSEIWNVPMAGFYTYGEYGRALNGRQEFHSTTCCWVALKEK